MKELKTDQLLDVNGGNEALGVLGLFAILIPFGLGYSTGYSYTINHRTPVHFYIGSKQEAELAAQFVSEKRNSSDKIYSVGALR